MLIPDIVRNLRLQILSATKQVLLTSPEATQISTPLPQPDYQVLKDNYITFNYLQRWTAKGVSGQVNTLTVKGEAQLVKLQESNKAIQTCSVSTGSAFILLGKLSGTQFTSSPYGNPGTFGFGNVNIAGEKNGDLPESSLQILGIDYSATNADEFTKHLVEFLNSVERLG
ncbi:MAG: hypothetical protein ACOCXT_05100 [Candidatus Dojkabacteria bacterium]